MAAEILKSTETTGIVFQVGKNGVHDIRVASISSQTVSLQSRIPGVATWINVDSDRAQWDEDGHGAIYMSSAYEYRMSSTASGPIAHIDSERNQAGIRRTIREVS